MYMVNEPNGLLAAIDGDTTDDGGGIGWENNIGSLRVFMATLRKKLETGPDSPSYIQTHIGVGYRMIKLD